MRPVSHPAASAAPRNSAGPCNDGLRHLSATTGYVTPPVLVSDTSWSAGGGYSASVSPEPPSSAGKSLSLGRPSFMGSTVDS